MNAKLFRVILSVSDIERAAGFYEAVLGAPGMRISPGRHYFDCGGTILACFSPGEDGDGWIVGHRASGSKSWRWNAPKANVMKRSSQQPPLPLEGGEGWGEGVEHE